MKSLAQLVLLSTLAIALPRGAAADTVTWTNKVVRLDKRQTRALIAAVDAMRQHNYGLRGQQIHIRDAGDFYFITFMAEPIDIAVAGDEHAKEWQVRKRDAYVVRELLVR